MQCLGAGSVRVWWGEAPPIAYALDDAVEQEVPAPEPTQAAAALCAVEMSQHVGPQYVTGLLGAVFEPASSRSLRIQMHTNRAGTRLGVFEGALAARVDTVRVGLPVEYARPALDAVLEALSLEQGRVLGPGVLTFKYAAHGLAGSSPSVFRRLGRATIRLLRGYEDSMSDREACALLFAVDRPTKS